MEPIEQQAAAKAELMAQLNEACYEFDFFQAVRRLDACFAHEDYPRIGFSQSRAGDPIHFGQRPFLEFAPRTIDRWSLEQLPECRFARPGMLVYFFGLFGPDGALPLHQTAYAMRRERANDFTITNFLNIFHHRFIAFFYRAWASTRIAVDLDRPDQQRFSSWIGSFFGEGSRPTQLREEEFEFRYRRPRPAPAKENSPDGASAAAEPGFSAELIRQSRDWPKLFFAGRLAPQIRNAEGLQSIIEYYFQVPTSIQTFFGRWFDIPQDSQCNLGVALQNCVLGSAVLPGTQFWDCQMSFRVRLGPMPFSDFQRLLPGKESFQRLKHWVCNYVGWRFHWDAQLVLDKDAVPETTLGDGGLLGWTTFVRTDSLLFTVDEIVNLPCFAGRFRQPARDDFLSQYLVSQLSPPTVGLLAKYAGGPDSALQHALVEDLNRLLQSGSIYDPQRFKGVALSEESMSRVGTLNVARETAIRLEAILSKTVEKRLLRTKVTKDGPEWVEQMKLVRKTAGILAREPEGLDLIPLNLALLLDAYGPHLAKKSKPFERDCDDLVVSPDD